MDNRNQSGVLPELREITLDDRDEFARALGRLREPISDTSFATSFLWAEALELSWGEIEGHLCVFSAADGDLSMMLPPLALDDAAEARLGACLDACFEVMDAYNAPRLGVERSRIEYVSDELLDRIRASEGADGRPGLSASVMPGDYVYPVRSIVELGGGDLKSKRRLRNLFRREHPEVEVGGLTREDVGECLGLLEKWKRHGDEAHEGEANDHLIGTDVLRRRDEKSTIAALRHFRALGLEAMVVRVGVGAGRRIVGFTIGERLSPTMGVVYVEKTDPEVEGTAQFIYSAFCERAFGGCAEVNAGDDWGIPSLRFTKTSYRPSRMLSKSVLTRQAVHVAGGGEPAVVAVAAGSEPVVYPHTGGSPEGLVIRAGLREDAAGLGEIEARAFRDEGERFTVRQIRRLIANPRAGVAVAELDGRVVGWTVSLVRRHRRWRSGRVYAIAVDPAQAGRGIGRRLMEHALGAFAAGGIARVYLEVRADNEAARTLYRSLGFGVIARLPGYYGEGAMGVRMRRVGEAAGGAGRGSARGARIPSEFV